MSELTKLIDKTLIYESQFTDELPTARYTEYHVISNLLAAHDREIKLTTAREVLEAACTEKCICCRHAKTYGQAARVGSSQAFRHEAASSFPCEASDIRIAVLTLYPELAQPVERRIDASDAVSGLHFARPSDFQQLHHNEPGKERSDG